MKRTLLMLMMASALIISCSEDKDDASGEDAIVGTWVMSSVEMEGVEDTTLLFLKDTFNKLLSSGCQLLTLTFNEDGSEITETKIDYIAGHDVNSDGTGLEIACPTEKKIDINTWSMSGNVITITDESGSTEQVTIKMDGNTFSVLGKDMDDNENLAEARVIFTKK